MRTKETGTVTVTDKRLERYLGKVCRRRVMRASMAGTLCATSSTTRTAAPPRSISATVACPSPTSWSSWEWELATARHVRSQSGLALEALEEDGEGDGEAEAEEEDEDAISRCSKRQDGTACRASATTFGVSVRYPEREESKR